MRIPIRFSDPVIPTYTFSLNPVIPMVISIFSNPTSYVHFFWISPLAFRRARGPIVVSFNGQGQLCLLTCGGWRDLSEWARFNRDQKQKEPCNTNLVLPPTHLSFHLILRSFCFPKNFSHQNEGCQMSSKRKKWRKKSKKRWERKRKEILLSAHARTSQANMLHLNQKAAKCTTCKQVWGKKKKGD